MRYVAVSISLLLKICSTVTSRFESHANKPNRRWNSAKAIDSGKPNRYNRAASNI